MTINWVLALVIGIVVGALHFGGLWLTVGRVIAGRGGGVLSSISGVARVAMAGAAFYALSKQGALQAMAALAGFWCARWYLLLRLGGGGNAE